MASLTLIIPDMVDMRGGTLVEIQGVFTPNQAYQVFLGPEGVITDSPCYSGIPGQGYFCYSNRAGTLLYAVTPPIANGSIARQHILVHPFTGIESDGKINLDIIESAWHSSVFNFRRNFPPWCSVRSRRLELEDLLNLLDEEFVPG